MPRPAPAGHGALGWDAYLESVFDDIYGGPAGTSLPSAEQQAAIQAAVNALVAGAPGALDTLNELATALGDDANFAATVTAALAGKADQSDLDSLETSLPATYASVLGSGAGSVPAAAVAAASTGRYDPSAAIYNGTNAALRHIRTALGNALAGAGYARINLVGDSLVDGSNPGGQLWKNGFAGQLRDLLAAEYGSGGTGVVHMIAGSYTSDDRIVTTGTWTGSSFGAFGAGCIFNGAGGTVTFTPDVPVDSFTVWYATGAGGGTFTYAVDGGSTTNVNSNGADGFTSVTVAAGAARRHKLTLTAPGSGSLFLVAIEGTNGSTGVRVTRCGKGGSKATDFDGTGTAPVTSYAALNTTAPPDLTIIAFLANEATAGQAVATYKTAMQNIITQAQLTGDVLILLEPFDPVSATVPPLVDYRTALYQLADANACALLDAHDLFGAGNTAYSPLGLLNSDQTHPTLKGHSVLASTMKRAMVNHPSPRPPAQHVYNWPTGGDLSVSSTTLAGIAASNGLAADAADLRVKARAGDTLTITLGFLPDTAAAILTFDAVTVVAGSVTNYVSSGTGSTMANGVAAWFSLNGDQSPVVGSFDYIVQSGDVDSDGNVTLRLYAKSNNGTTRTLYCGSRQSQWSVRCTPAAA